MKRYSSKDNLTEIGGDQDLQSKAGKIPLLFLMTYLGLVTSLQQFPNLRREKATGNNTQ
jgi:hypothetical protein